MNKKILASQISKRSGFNGILGSIYSGIGAIFMLHRVLDDELELDDTLFTSPSFLDCYISYLKKKNIDIVSPSEVLNRIQSNRPKYFVCFSFDDGYKDNLNQAFPVFLKHQVPFSINVTKDMIDRKLFYWWRGIEIIFTGNDEVSFTYEDKKYHFINYTYLQKRKNYQSFLEVIHQNKVNLNEKINPLFDKYNIDIQKVLEDEALSENDLKKLSSSHLVTFGSHAVTHKSLKTLSEDEVRYEMAESKSFLEAITSKRIEHFAYPFGGPNVAGSREFRIAKESGYLTATTSRNGTIKKAHKNYLQVLPRLPFNRSIESVSWMEFQRIGIVSQLKMRTLNPLLITE